ncbi:hypothetical protein CPB86DRAFT_764407 [Serendipita vermifera]|nr:hypothetical protein CPB86DRAFT_764407 [Serendipita vermifera]
MPRSTGTCTRCPIICRMSKRGDISWRCNIWLDFEFDEDGEPLRIPERRRQFGPEITRPEEVHQRILQAQAAILHYPMTDPDEFLSPNANLSGDGFSHNAICIEIDGHDVESLSFVDLPGIIAMDPPNQPGMKDMVHNLATKYIEKDSSLILVVYHCDDDELNQGAAQLAKTYDPEEERTIVVLTKPDLIAANINPDDNDPEAATHWQNKVRRSENCFCVRQPSRNKTSIRWTDARRQEMEFFQRDWKPLFDDPITNSRLGTVNLRNHLSSRLYKWILRGLPRLQEKARLRLHQMETELRSLPKPVDQPVKYMESLLWDFNKKVEDAIDIHKFHNPPLIRACRSRLEEFDDVLVYNLFPRFRPFPSGSSQVDEEYREEHATSARIPQLNRRIEIPEVVYLDEVMAKSKERGREVPGNHPYGVKKEFMETSVKAWRNETDAMLEDISYSISATLQELISEHFGMYQDGELEELVSRIVQSHVQLLYEEARNALLASQERERINSAIFGCAEFDSFYEIYLEHYTRGFRFKNEGTGSAENAQSPLDHPLFDHLVDVVATANPTIRTEAERLKEATRAHYGGEKTEHDHLFTERPAAPVSVEKWAIDVMASTRAFYHIAVRRYAGGSEQLVLYDLLLNLSRGRTLTEKLEEGIGLKGPDGEKQCAHYVELSKDVTKRYNEVDRRITVLRDFLREVSKTSST